MSKQKNRKRKINTKAKTSQNQLDISNWTRNTRLHKWLIFTIAFLLYGNTLTHEYTQDDAIVI